MLAKYDHYPLMDNSRVFTSLALMQLLLEPVAFFITALSGLMSAIGCFERIRIYLNCQDHSDSGDFEPLLDDDTTRFRHHYSSITNDENDEASIELIESKNQYPHKEEFCVVAGMASCGWDKKKDPVLRDLNFEIRRDKLTMIIGPVSSGKSTLLKAMIGETAEAAGFTHIPSGDVAYCAQTPWLTNATVKENIMGDSFYDPRWYESVIRACALDTDLAQFALGEHTVIGSKGLALSGGQKMRVVSRYSSW